MRCFCPTCRMRHSVKENDVLAAAEKIIRKRRSKGIPLPEFFDGMDMPEANGNLIDLSNPDEVRQRDEAIRRRMA